MPKHKEQQKRNGRCAEKEKAIHTPPYRAQRRLFEFRDVRLGDGLAFGEELRVGAGLGFLRVLPHRFNAPCEERWVNDV
jgi:hypothetical protein